MCLTSFDLILPLSPFITLKFYGSKSILSTQVFFGFFFFFFFVLVFLIFNIGQGPVSTR